MLRRHVLLLPLILALPAAARAQPGNEFGRRAADLDAKFAALHAARSDDEADPIVSDIWSLWLQSGREDIDVLLRQATMLMHSSANGLALRILDEVVAKAPDYAEGWNKRATLLYIMGEYDRSRADCEEVVKREPRHFGALAGMGLIAVAQSDFKAALAAYRRALAANPWLKERDGIIPALEKKVEGEPL